MQIFKNRPLALFGAVLALFAVLAQKMDGEEKAILATVCLCLGGIALLFAVKCKKMKAWLRYPTACLLGAAVALGSSYLFFNLYYEDCQAETGECMVVEGTVLDRGFATSFSSVFSVSLDTLNGEDCVERVILECEYPSALQIGDKFFATVTQRAFSNSASYDEEQAYLSDGYTRILVCGSSEDCEIAEEKGNGLQLSLRKWNRRLSAKLVDAIGQREGGLAAALLLGNRSFLSDETTLHFRRAGISHMLSLSGMHVSILVGFLELILRKLRIGKLIRAGIVPTVLLGYLALTGFSVSATRAVLMVCILYLGVILRSDYDSLTALCAILALLLTVTPYAVLDLSLWMSFLAAASIIIFFPWIRAFGMKIRGEKPHPPFLRRILASVTEGILIGIVANAALLFLSAAVFGEISVLSVPATLLLSVPMSVLMIVSIPLVIFPNLFLLSRVCRFLTKLMLDVTAWLSDLDGVLFPIGDDTEKIILLVLTVILILLAVARLKHSVWLLSVPFLMIVLFVTSYCMTLNAPRAYLASSEETGQYAVLCEGGEMIAVDQGAVFAADSLKIASLAKEMRCTEIGDLVLTEYDNRGAYLIGYLSERIKIRRLRLPIPTDEKERAIAERIEQEALLHGIEVRYEIEKLCIDGAADPFQWKKNSPVGK